MPEKEIKSCSCGSNGVVFLKDFWELVAVSQKFEQEDGILGEFQKQVGNDDLRLQPNFSLSAEGDGYEPYCNIKFKASPGVVEQN